MIVKSRGSANSRFGISPMVTTMHDLFSAAMALVPVFPSREDIDHLRAHNDFWRLRNTANIADE